MEREVHYITNYEVWDEQVAFNYFSDKISIENMRALIDHICDDGVAQEILSVIEKDGILELNSGTGNTVKVEQNDNK